MADFIADSEVFPESQITSYEEWFGLIMNSERIVHRKARRRMDEFTIMTSGREIPYEMFRSSTYTKNHAKEEFDLYNLSLERKYAESEGN